MQWTLLAPYIASCPASSPEVAWTAFPTLEIDNNPYWPDLNNNAAISTFSAQGIIGLIAACGVASLSAVLL